MNKTKTPISIVLPDIRSAMNIGAIFRTADAMGAEKIYLTGYSATPEHPKVVKTSLGAEETVAWEYQSDSMETIQKLKSQGKRIYGLELTDKSKCIWDVDYTFPAVVVVGNEIKGIDEEILTLCDEIIYIPMLGSKESLNVATAAGIALYKLLESYSCKP
jgi:23S rRNA (guanosine2251-2'-O)-methyltransferase